MVNTLVVYYSLEGNCELVANTIMQEIGCPVQRLIVKKDLDKTKFTRYLWGGKQAMMKAKPEIEPLQKNPSDYDLIIIGTPVWAFTYSPAIRSFLSQAKLSGKYVAFFCCHEGSKGKTLQRLEEDFSGNTCVGKIDFFAPLKKETEKSKVIAQAWAKEVFAKVKIIEENKSIEEEKGHAK